MYDTELIVELLSQMLVAAKRIERRFGSIRTPDDFLKSDDGIDRLDAIAMMLIVLGESVKNLDKATDGTLLPQFPEVDWKGAKGVRDIMSHHYVDIDAEVIFDICQTFIPPLIATIEKMRQEIVNGTV
ncbi:MAG: HepT-like ribonuclease domain-containing protein [Armatimonadota bacterium]